MQTSSAQRNVLDHLLGWWFAITAPPVVSDDAPLREREIVRIGKIASAILFFEIIYVTMVLGIALTIDPHVLPALLIEYLMITIGLVCNRRGRVRIAAVITFVAQEAGMLSTIIALSAGGFNSPSLPLFDVLVIPELIAVSLFPAWVVLPAAVFNSLCTLASLAFLPKTPELNQALARSWYGIAQRPVAIQIITALALYLWVSTAIQGMRRADSAEEVNKLSRALAAQQQMALQEKQQLEESVEQIVKVHMQVANGNFKARVPLDGESVLWSIAGSLNNLLARLQSWRQAAQQAHLLEQSIQQTLHEIQQAKIQGVPLHYRRTGTMLDPLMAEFIENISPDLSSYQQADITKLMPGQPFKRQVTRTPLSPDQQG